MGTKISSDIIERAIKDYVDNHLSVVSCARKYDIGATTLTRYLNKVSICTSFFDTRRYDYNQDFFSVIDTEEKAYWLGFIAADGSILRSKGNAKEFRDSIVEITLKRSDKDHLLKFVHSIDGQKEMVSDRYQNSGNKLHEASRVTVCSMKMCQDLSQYGIARNKGLKLDFPDLTGELLKHYLRGYFDGDGSISTNGTYRKGNPKYAVSLVATESFLESFILHMMDYGITRVKLQNRGPLKNWNKVGANQICTVLDYLYSDCTIYLDRKYQLAIDLLCRLKPKTTEDLR